MKKYIMLLLSITILINVSCFGLFDSTLTITNNCTVSVSVNYSYFEDGYYYGDTITIYPGDTKKVSISAETAHVSVFAYRGSDLNVYSYHGGDHNIVMYDSHF